MTHPQLLRVIIQLSEIIEILRKSGVAVGELEKVLSRLSTETEAKVINEALQWLRSATEPRGLPGIYLSDEPSTWFGKISMLRHAVEAILPPPPLSRFAKKLLNNILIKSNS